MRLGQVICGKLVVVRHGLVVPTTLRRILLSLVPVTQRLGTVGCAMLAKTTMVLVITYMPRHVLVSIHQMAKSSGTSKLRPAKVGTMTV